MKEKEYLIDLFENPVRFLESKYGYYVPETRKPIRHQAWEQQLLQAVVSSEKKIRAIGDIKKNLKTTKAAEVVYLTALKYPNSEIYIKRRRILRAPLKTFMTSCPRRTLSSPPTRNSKVSVKMPWR